jgi:hypothetical protein
VRARREPTRGDTVTKVWDTFSALDPSREPDTHQTRADATVSEPEEAPAESFATAKLRADVARQQMRLAKEQLKRARKRFKEARREARQARKLVSQARRVWKKAKRGAKGRNSEAQGAVAKVASGAAPKPSRRGRRAHAVTGKGADKPVRKTARAAGRRRGRGGRAAKRRSRAEAFVIFGFEAEEALDRRAARKLVFYPAS